MFFIMIEYFLLLFSLFLLPNLFRNRKLIIMGSFLSLFIFSSIRYGMSYDYGIYVRAIKNEWYHNEFGSALLEQIAHKYFGIQSFFVISSFIINFFICKAIYRGSSSVMTSIFFYIGMPFFFMQDLSTVRQALGTSIIFYLTVSSHTIKFSHYSKLKSYIIKFLLILVAYSFHSSAVIAILLLFPWEKINEKIIWIAIFVSMAIGLAGKSIILLLASSFSADGQLGGKLDQYVTEQMDGLILLRILLYSIGFLILINYKKLIRVNYSYKYFINIMGVGLCFMGIFSVNPHLGLRLCLYFFFPTIIMIPDFLALYRINQKIFQLCCILLFCITIYSYQLNAKGDNFRHFYPFINIFSDKARFNLY